MTRSPDVPRQPRRMEGSAFDPLRSVRMGSRAASALTAAKASVTYWLSR